MGSFAVSSCMSLQPRREQSLPTDAPGRQALLDELVREMDLPDVASVTYTVSHSRVGTDFIKNVNMNSDSLLEFYLGVALDHPGLSRKEYEAKKQQRLKSASSERARALLYFNIAHARTRQASLMTTLLTDDVGSRKKSYVHVYPLSFSRDSSWSLVEEDLKVSLMHEQQHARDFAYGFNPGVSVTGENYHTLRCAVFLYAVQVEGHIAGLRTARSSQVRTYALDGLQMLQKQNLFLQDLDMSATERTIVQHQKKKVKKVLST